MVCILRLTRYGVDKLFHRTLHGLQLGVGVVILPCPERASPKSCIGIIRRLAQFMKLTVAPSTGIVSDLEIGLFPFPVFSIVLPRPICFRNDLIIPAVYFNKVIIPGLPDIVIRPLCIFDFGIRVPVLTKAISHGPRGIQHQHDIQGSSRGGRGDSIAGIGLHIQPVIAISVCTDPLIHGNLILRIGHRVFLGAAFGWRSQRRHRQQAHAQRKHAYPT